MRKTGRLGEMNDSEIVVVPVEGKSPNRKYGDASICPKCQLFMRLFVIIFGTLHIAWVKKYFSCVCQASSYPLKKIIKVHVNWLYNTSVVPDYLMKAQ